MALVSWIGVICTPYIFISMINKRIHPQRKCDLYTLYICKYCKYAVRPTRECNLYPLSSWAKAIYRLNRQRWCKLYTLFSASKHPVAFIDNIGANCTPYMFTSMMNLFAPPAVQCKLYTLNTNKIQRSRQFPRQQVQQHLANLKKRDPQKLQASWRQVKRRKG